MVNTPFNKLENITLNKTNVCVINLPLTSLMNILEVGSYDEHNTQPIMEMHQLIYERFNRMNSVTKSTTSRLHANSSAMTL